MSYNHLLLVLFLLTYASFNSEFKELQELCNAYTTVVVLLSVKLCSSTVTVQRNIGTGISGPFYHSIDRFTNKDNNKKFCSERNAICTVETNCSICECRLDDIFISYQHGCKNTTETKTILKRK